LLAHVLRPDGTPVRIARIDADSTRLKGALENQLAQVHSGEVDVLVGTQMIAKGHDFRRITLVAAVNPDTALFSSDFRAPERLFALLMQAAGRAGRDAAQSGHSEMWVQTFHPTHALFEALKKHDYPAFAASELAERTAADLPPISHQALLRADARTQEAAQALLNAARETLEAQLSADPETADLVLQVSVYPAVPMSMQRVADVERAQMLLESPSRMALQKMLWHLHSVLHQVRSLPEHKGVIRWLVDVDPQAI
jgi:primosomal protein N' (replication factor Y)